MTVLQYRIYILQLYVATCIITLIITHMMQDLEVSLKAWEEKQRSSGSQTKQPTLLADEELPLLATLAATVSAFS